MVSSSSATRSEGRFLQLKWKGIHEPKGRVKGFRVEIRPPNSSLKIWVGTFDTREKAMRAFDAAVYLTGKEPHYFVYPEKYFPSRITNLSKEEVQKQAKLLAYRTDNLEMKRFPGFDDYLKTVESQKADERTILNNEKKSLDTSVLSESWLSQGELDDEFWQILAEPDDEFWQILAELDDQLYKAEYMELPSKLPNSDWIFDGFAPIQKTEVDSEESAFLEGYSTTPFHEFADGFVFSSMPNATPATEDESLISDLGPPLKVASKRKRDVIEEGGAVTNDRKNVWFSEDGGAASDAWLRTMFDNDPSQLTFFPRVCDSNPCSDDSDEALAAIC